MKGWTELELAVAVILVRPTDSPAFEVLLARGPANARFWGDTVGFPGGPLRTEDCGAAAISRCRGIAPAQARRILGAHLPPEAALGHWVAAMRALYEQTGILLAVPEHGQTFDSSNVAASATNFRLLLARKGLLWDAARLAYFSHWQTPMQFSTRFDTRFFLAFMPGDRTLIPPPGKMAFDFWLTPDRALTLCDRGALALDFAVFACLRALADFDSLDSLVREYKLGVAS